METFLNACCALRLIAVDSNRVFADPRKLLFADVSFVVIQTFCR
jgi:hypothetical protein